MEQVAYSTDCKFVVLSLGQNYQRFFLKLVCDCRTPDGFPATWIGSTEQHGLLLNLIIPSC